MKIITEILIIIFIILGTVYFVDRPNFLINKKPVEEAKQYCELLIKEIEQYKITNGVYPDNLNMINVKSEMPSLLENTKLHKENKHKIFYMKHKDGKGYSLWFDDPRKTSYFYEYNYEKKAWWEHT